jgi:hypothetical protein
MLWLELDRANTVIAVVSCIQEFCLSVRGTLLSGKTERHLFSERVYWSFASPIVETALNEKSRGRCGSPALGRKSYAGEWTWLWRKSGERNMVINAYGVTFADTRAQIEDQLEKRGPLPPSCVHIVWLVDNECLLFAGYPHPSVLLTSPLFSTGNNLLDGTHALSP